jgi:hypothetical protein
MRIITPRCAGVRDLALKKPGLFFLPPSREIEEQ